MDRKVHRLGIKTTAAILKAEYEEVYDMIAMRQLKATLRIENVLVHNCVAISEKTFNSLCDEYLEAEISKLEQNEADKKVLAKPDKYGRINPEVATEGGWLEWSTGLYIPKEIYTPRYYYSMFSTDFLAARFAAGKKIMGTTYSGELEIAGNFNATVETFKHLIMGDSRKNDRLIVLVTPDEPKYEKIGVVFLDEMGGEKGLQSRLRFCREDVEALAEIRMKKFAAMGREKRTENAKQMRIALLEDYINSGAPNPNQYAHNYYEPERFKAWGKPRTRDSVQKILARAKKEAQETPHTPYETLL